MLEKYADHLPLYRQRQRFTREGIPIAQSTLDGWASQAMDRLEILWDHLATYTKTALSWIPGLYAVEQQARDTELSLDERKEVRLARSLPIINTLGVWIHAEVLAVLPKSQIGKAMAYAAKRWDALSEYLHDGLLDIDNNLVEDTIRPLALGRKTTCSLAHTPEPGGLRWYILC